MKHLRLLICIVCIVFGITSALGTRRNPYTTYIKKHSEEPMAYIADKIRTHSVVAIGEDHWIKDHPLFLCDMIHAMAADTTANIDVLAVEFGNESDQKLVNELLAAEKYREDLVFKILQHAPDTYGNPYKEYAEVFRAVWETNKIKKPKFKTHILLLDPAYTQQYLDGDKYAYTCSRDDNMFGKIRSCIIQRKHVVFYAGQAHTQAGICGVQLNSYYYNYPSAGYLLKKCYPDDVFIINLWGAHMGSNGYEPCSTGRWQRIAGGVIDEAFKANGNKPVAFSLLNDFPKLTEYDYRTRPGNRQAWPVHPQNGSPYSAETLMCEHIDGIVFIKPVEQLSGAHLIDIYDNDFMTHIKKRSGGKITTAQEVLDYLKGHHPILEK